MMRPERQAAGPRGARAGWAIQSLLVLLTVIGSLVVATFMVRSREVPETLPTPATVPLVEVLDVRLGRVQLFIDTLGELRPRREGTLTAEVPGTVDSVSDAFVDGGAVAEGEVLLQIDDARLRVAILSADAMVAQAAARLSQEVAQSERSIAEWTQSGRSGDPPPLVAREPALAEARARVASAEATLEDAKLDLERTKVKAPFSGFVRDARAAIGEFVQPGQVLATLYQAEPMEVSFALTDRELARMDLDALMSSGTRPESAPVVEFDASFAGRRSTFRGRIARVESEVDPVSRMVRLSAVVDRAAESSSPGDAARLPLLAGVFVDARIGGRVLEQAVTLPRSALFRPDVVLIVSKEGRLERREVAVALTTRESVVIEEGLGDGERVIVSPLDVAIDGMFVRVSGATGAEAHTEATSVSDQ